MDKINSVSLNAYKDGDFTVFVRDHNGLREAWLLHEDYGTAEYMFGLPIRQEGRPAMFYNQFLSIVEANLKEYEREYAERHFD